MSKSLYNTFQYSLVAISLLIVIIQAHSFVFAVNPWGNSAVNNAQGLESIYLGIYALFGSKAILAFTGFIGLVMNSIILVTKTHPPKVGPFYRVFLVTTLVSAGMLLASIYLLIAI